MDDAGALLRALALAAALAACGGPLAPEPIAFDREPCRHCRMLISDPAFAAQLRTEAGETLAFDDPGCLIRYRQEHAPAVRAAWFHHLSEDRWIPESEVAFVPVPATPMDFGLGAVEAGTPGSISLGAAEAHVRERAAAGRAPETAQAPR
jgi:copper chaperone NosL